MLDFGKIVEALKLPTQVFVWLALVSGALLFGPIRLIELLGLLGFRQSYRPWIGLTFLVSIAVVTVALFTPIWNIIRRELRDNWLIRRQSKYLADLTPRERKILRGYIQGDTRTQTFHIGDGAVRELESKLILRRASNLGAGSGWGFAYNIQPWAWDYLKRHPELVAEESQEEQ